MSDVFISYARKDNQDGFISNLVTALEQEGLTVWIDRNEIPLGAEWWQEICQGIEGAHTFSAIISPNFANSDVCRDEVNHALTKNKRFIPIHAIDLDQETYKRLPPKLAQHNWTYIRPTDSLIEAVKPYIQAIRTDLDFVRAHTRLLQRAEEWSTRNKNASFLLHGQDLKNAEDWLARSSTLEPKPTELQSQYIFASRRSANNFQRSLLAGVSTALVVTLVLAVISFALFRVAERRADEAQSLALSASAQQALTVGNTDLSLTLALEANTISDPPSRAADALSAAAFSPGTKWRLIGHNKPVRSVAYSPDGKSALSGDWDGHLITWNLVTGREQARFDFPQRNLLGDFSVPGTQEASIPTIIYSVDYSPDGKTALIGTITDAYLWDMRTNKQIKRFVTNGLSVHSIKFSPDGKLALTGMNDYTLILWDIATERPIRVLKGHTEEIFSGAFSPNGRFIASSSRDKTIIVWDTATGEIVKTLTYHTDLVNQVAFSPDGHWIGSVGNDNVLYLWDTNTGENTRLALGNNTAINTLAFSPDSKTVVTGGSDYTLTFWRIETGTVIQRLYGHDAAILSLAYSPDGHTVLSASEDKTVRLWYTNTPAEHQQLIAHDKAIRGLAVSTDGRYVATSSADQTAKLWDAATGQLIRTFKGHTDSVARVAISPDARNILTASTDGTVRLWDLQTGQELDQLPIGDGLWASGIGYSPDGQNALIIVYNPTNGLASLIYLDIKNWKEIRRYKVKDGLLYTSLTFAPTGDKVLLGTAEASTNGELGYLSLLNLKSTDEAKPVGDPSVWHHKGVYSVALSPDGRYALSGSSDNTIGLWDIKTGALLRHFEGHTNIVRGLAFSADGKSILSGADDATVILWDLRTGTQIVRYQGHSSYINAVAFLPNSRLALSVSEDRTLRYWQLPMPVKDMIDWSYQNRYVRELTCEERLTYAVRISCDDTGKFATRTPNAALLAALPSESVTAVASVTPTPVANFNRPQPTPTVYDKASILAAVNDLPFDVLLPADIPGISISNVNTGNLSGRSINTTSLGETIEHIMSMTLDKSDSQFTIIEYPSKQPTLREWVKTVMKGDSRFEQAGLLEYKTIRDVEVVRLNTATFSCVVFKINQTMVDVCSPATEQSSLDTIIDALIPPNGTIKAAAGQP